eukprot:m.71300 g.71300  ORF g.71300 m.71300 type:complete len:579 (-) comp14207_c0_seq1:24-1760(-)
MGVQTSAEMSSEPASNIATPSRLPRSGSTPLSYRSRSGSATSRMSSGSRRFNEPDVREGDYVGTIDDVRTGTVRYVGTTTFKTGRWVGIEVDENQEGKNDGSVQGRRYFHCEENRGVFVPINHVKVLAVGGGDERIHDLQQQLNQAYKEMASLKCVYEKQIVDLGGSADDIIQHTGVDLPPRALAVSRRPESREAASSSKDTPSKGGSSGRAEKELLRVAADIKAQLAELTAAAARGTVPGVATSTAAPTVTSNVDGAGFDGSELTRLHNNLMHKDELIEAQMTQLSTTQEEVSRLQVQLSEEQATASFCQKELDLLRERQEADTTQLQARLEKAESALETKEAALAALQDEHRQLQTAHEVLKARDGNAAPPVTMAAPADSSSNINGDEGVAAAALQRENDALISQKEALEARVAEVTAELAQLKTELVSLRDKEETTSKERTAALSEAADLKVELATLKGDLAAAKTAAESAVQETDARQSPTKMVDSLLHQDRQALSELLTTHFEHIQALKGLQRGDGAVAQELSREVDDMISLHMESLTKRLTKCEDAMDVHFSRGNRESVSVDVVDLQGEDFF